MNREDARKLLGGYATGTLTPAEQSALFAAALDDQDLFDELAKEQALRDLLADPAARGQLLAALDEPKPEPWYRRRWIFAPLAVAVPAVAVLLVLMTRPAPKLPATVAMLEAPPPAPRLPQPVASVPATASAPAQRARKPEPVALPPAAESRAKRAAPPSPATLPPPSAGRRDDRETEVKDARKEVAEAVVVAETPKIAVMSAGEGAGLGGAASPALANPAPPGAPSQNAKSLFFAAVPQAQLFDTTATQKVAEQNQPSAQNQSPQNQSAQNQQTPSPQQGQIAGARQQLRTAVSTGALQRVIPSATGVSYTVLRQEANGQLVPVSELARNETTVIRLAANTRGHIVVTELGSGSGRVLLSTDTAPMATYNTVPLPSGETRVAVVFTRQPRQAESRTLTGRNLVETSSDQTTYVVNAQLNPPAAEISFTITLKYK